MTANDTNESTPRCSWPSLNGCSCRRELVLEVVSSSYGLPCFPRKAHRARSCADQDRWPKMLCCFRPDDAPSRFLYC